MDSRIGTAVHFVLETGPSAGRCRAAIVKEWLARGGRVAAILDVLPCTMDGEALYQEGREVAAVESEGPVPGRWHVLETCPNGKRPVGAPPALPTKVDS